MSTKRGPKMDDPTPKAVYQFVQKQSNPPFATSKDVHERFDSVSRRTINDRLNRLHDDGQLKKRKIGANTAIWYVDD